MNQYTVGQSIQLSVTFKDAAGVPFDPQEVKAWIRLPDLDVVELTEFVERTNTGVYIAVYTPLQNGLYEYRFEGDGVTDSAGETNFYAQTVFPDLES